jgi:hypothetical protein
MAIVVKHGGNPAPALVGAYGAGIGKRQAEEARQQAQLAAAEEAQRRNLEAQQREAALGREFTLGRDEAGQERSLQTMRLSADLREGSAEAEQLRRREDVEWGYSARQRQEFEDMARSYDEAVNSGEFSEDELKEVKRQVIAKQAGITPLPKLTQKQITPEERLKTSTTTLPDGAVIGFKPDGTPFRLLESPAIKQAESMNKDMEDALAQATEELNEASSKGDGARPSSEDKLTRAEEIFKEKQAFRKRLTGGATAEGGAGAAGTDDPDPKKKPVSVKAPNGKVFTARQ